MSRKFQARKEDFICEHCGTAVQGNGYTNHCPECLWSKHVDENPGDRLSSCNGMMKPISVEKKKTSFALLLRCVKCGAVKPNIISENDNFGMITQISSKIANAR